MRLTNPICTFLNFDFNPNLDTNYPSEYGNSHTDTNLYSIGCTNLNLNRHCHAQRDRHQRTRIPHGHQSARVAYTNNLHT